MSLKGGLFDFLRWAAGSATNMSNSASLAVGLMNMTDTDALVIEGAYNVICPIAVGLSIVYTLSAIVEDYFNNRGEINMQMLAKNLIGFLLSLGLITNADSIAGAALSIIGPLGATVRDSLSEATDKIQLDDNGDMDSSTLVGAALMTVLTFPLILIEKIIVKFIMIVFLFSFKIEILLRFAFAPIAYANFSSELNRQKGLAYLRKLTASLFWCAGIVVMFFAVQQAWQSIGNENSIKYISGDLPFDGIMKWVLLIVNRSVLNCVAPLASIGAISVAKNVVNEVFS